LTGVPPVVVVWPLPTPAGVWLALVLVAVLVAVLLPVV
jgi:hypothetical protein